MRFSRTLHLRHSLARRVLLAAIAGIGAVAVGQNAADATSSTSQTCLESAVLTFTPPLTIGSQSGTVSATWTRTCVDASASTSPPGESATVITDGGPADVPYLGSCALALIGGNEVGVLLGGSVLMSADAGVIGGDAKETTYVPDQVCNESTASGAGPKMDFSMFF